MPKWLNPRNFLVHLPPVTQDGIHDGNRGRDRDGDLGAIVGQKTRMPGRILPWTKKTVSRSHTVVPLNWLSMSTNSWNWLKELQPRLNRWPRSHLLIKKPAAWRDSAMPSFFSSPLPHATPVTCNSPEHAPTPSLIQPRDIPWKRFSQGWEWLGFQCMSGSDSPRQIPHGH